MKAYVEAHDNAVFVYWDWGYMSIRPDGRYNIWTDNEGTLRLSSTGVYDWESGMIESCPSNLADVLEAILDRWVRSADGQDWIRRHIA
jgi:hypothetical protein